MADEPKNMERTLTGSMPVVLKTMRAARPHLLEQVEGPGAPRRIELEGDRMVIGREGDVAIASVHLSRSHLRLTREGNDFSFVDLESRNGVYLNGVRVHSAVLREGDLLQLGDVVFLYLAGA